MVQCGGFEEGHTISDSDIISARALTPVMPMLASIACLLRTAMSRLRSLVAALSPSTASAHGHSFRSDACCPTMFLYCICHAIPNHQPPGVAAAWASMKDLLGRSHMGIIKPDCQQQVAQDCNRLGLQGELSSRGRLPMYGL